MTTSAYRPLRSSSRLFPGRTLAAVSSITPAVSLTVSELDGILEGDADHDADLEALRGMLPDLAEATREIDREDLDLLSLEQPTRDALKVAERAIRRVRLLDP